MSTNGNGKVTRDIVAKLWRMCDLLRDGGVTYQDYVTELTYLLFLKMMQETERETILPKELRWNNLAAKEGEALLTFYRTMLLKLGTETKGIVREIFTDAQTSLKYPKDLKELVTQIDRLDWFSAKQDGLGDLYEGLLEKNAGEKKSGAGQYFTPRPLIDCMVRLMKPQPGQIVQDPAAGTGGVLIAADRYIKENTDELFALEKAEQKFQREDAFRGLELVHDTHRMLLMNLMLHDIGGTHVANGDALSPNGEALGKADLILSNPPFGTKKGGGKPTRSDFSITADSSNKQLAFIEHIVRALKPKGRAAVVVPDNVLFGEGSGSELRTWMMELCNLHTILRLPIGIFYAHGTKTNVLFLERGTAAKGNTKGIFIYDMRAGQPAYGKKRPLGREDFVSFEQLYLERDTSRWKEVEKWRYFSREEIAAQYGDELDIQWLEQDDSIAEAALEDPRDVATAVHEHLSRALSEIDIILSNMNGTPSA